MDNAHVCVAAYVVNIKDATSGHKEGLLQTVMFQTRIGVTEKSIWDCHCLRAVIEYKWRHWACKFLLFQLWAYFGWLGSYVIFLSIYIVSHRPKRHRDSTFDVFRRQIWTIFARRVTFCRWWRI